MVRRRNRMGGDTYSVARANGTSDNFAVDPINISTPDGRARLYSVAHLSQDAHQRAWTWFRNIGEVHYAITRGEKVAGYAELSAHELNADGSIGKKKGASSKAAKIVEMLQSPFGGKRGFVERYFEMMKIPGDTYLIRTRDKQGNHTGYDWLSSSEIDLTGIDFTIDRRNARESTTPLNRILVPKANGVEAQIAKIEPRDFLGRVWRPGGQYIGVSDSPMIALDMECELLHLLTISLKGKLTNRLALNGMMILSKDIQDVHSGAPSADGEAFHTNKVLNALLNSMTYAVANPTEPSSAMPIVLQANASTNLKPSEMVAMVTTDHAIDETDMKLRDELIQRIIMGLDVQPQHVRGLGDASHWSAWAVSDDERRISIGPDVEAMCWALTRLVLNAELQGQVSDAEIAKTVIWYDLTKANVKTNLAEDSRQMRDRKLVSEEGARRMSGIDETDAPTDDDRVRMLGNQIGNPYLALYGLDVAKTLDWDKVAEFMGKNNGPDAQSDADPSETSPGKGAPDKPATKPTPIKKAS